MIRNFTLRNYILYFFAAFCLISCEKDEIKPINADSVVPEFTGRIISSKDLIPNTMVYSRLMEFLEKPVAKSSYGIELDTSHIKVMETERYTSYTFKIHQDAEESKNVLRNFVLTYVNDTIQLQHTVDYPVLEDGNFDLDNAQMVRLYGDDLLTGIPMKCGGETMQSYSYEYCYPVYCYLSGEHGPGVPCTLDGVQRGYTNCVIRWRWESIAEDPCGTSNDGGYDSSGTGGSGTATGTDEQPDEADDILIGMDPNDGEKPILKDKDCNYLQDLLDDPIFKQRLRNLQESANDDMFERINEYTFDLNGVSQPFYEGQGTPRSPRAPSRTLLNTILRLILIHTHYKGDATNSMISMFSYEDLHVFTQDMLTVNIRGKDTSQMTSILVAADGTSWNVYAIKKDPDSEIANNYPLHQAINMTPAEIKEERDRYKDAIERAGDQRALEVIALKQFEKMGLQLYKTTGVHTGWERLTLKPNPTDSEKPELGTPISCN
jgi:archaellin